MNDALTIRLPPEMEAYRADLEFFFTIMVRKLHTNRYKGTGKNLDPQDMLLRAAEELEECWDALEDEGQFEFAVEAADAANFMFLAARGVLQMTREEYERTRDGNS